jgi:hypothetical protein
VVLRGDQADWQEGRTEWSLLPSEHGWQEATALMACCVPHLDAQRLAHLPVVLEVDLEEDHVGMLPHQLAKLQGTSFMNKHRCDAKTQAGHWRMSPSSFSVRTLGYSALHALHHFA